MQCAVREAQSYFGHEKFSSQLFFFISAISDVNHEMDVGLHGWGVHPQYSRSLYQGTLS